MSTAHQLDIKNTYAAFDLGLVVFADLGDAAFEPDGFLIFVRVALALERGTRCKHDVLSGPKNILLPLTEPSDVRIMANILPSMARQKANWRDRVLTHIQTH